MKFAPGQVVNLKSGGQPLTVVAVDGDSVECIWLGEEGDLFRETIPAIALEPTYEADAVADELEDDPVATIVEPIGDDEEEDEDFDEDEEQDDEEEDDEDEDDEDDDEEDEDDDADDEEEDEEALQPDEEEERDEPHPGLTTHGRRKRPVPA